MIDFLFHDWGDVGGLVVVFLVCMVPLLIIIYVFNL